MFWSIFEKLDSKFEIFFIEELKIFVKALVQYVYQFILNYLLQYAKRLVT